MLPQMTPDAPTKQEMVGAGMNGGPAPAPDMRATLVQALQAMRRAAAEAGLDFQELLQESEAGTKPTANKPPAMIPPSPPMGGGLG